MMKTVLLTAQSSAFDRQLAKIFAREGFDVYIDGKGEPPGALDIYIDTSDKRLPEDSFTVRGGLDEKVIRRTYKANVLRPMGLLEKYLPILDKGKNGGNGKLKAGGKGKGIIDSAAPCKRLCFITSSDASINETRDAGGYAYKMSKAAMHNHFMIAWNTLRPDGYTFRFFDPLLSSVSPKDAAESAFLYFTRRRGNENGDPLRDDEDRLVMRDALGREHAW